MEINHIIAELEEIASTASRVPGLRKKVMVDMDRLNRIVNEISKSLPSDMQEAQEIIKLKESILNQTQMEARRIKEGAMEEAEKMTSTAHKEHRMKTDETEIVRAAELKAEEIKQNALQEAQEIVKDGQRRAYRIIDEAEQAAGARREGSDQYARETLFDLEERLAGLLGQVRRGIDTLGMETNVRIPS